MEVRKVEPVEFEFDRIFVELMRQEPQEAAEKLLRAFIQDGRERERLLDNIELNIPDTVNVPTAFLLHVISDIKAAVSDAVVRLEESKMRLKIRGMSAKRLQTDTVQAMKDLFGVLDAKQIAKLQKAIDEVRGSLGT